MSSPTEVGISVSTSFPFRIVRDVRGPDGEPHDELHAKNRKMLDLAPGMTEPQVRCVVQALLLGYRIGRAGVCSLQAG